MSQAEVRTLVIYDIEDDRVRARVAKACRDYGLDHIQLSAFAGPLTATLRSELCRRLRDLIGRKAGRILVVPICAADAAAARDVGTQPTWAPPAGEKSWTGS